MNNPQNRRRKASVTTRRKKGAGGTGFTIIEVMIALALAGLIMLIFLLALPALQRNARNKQRDQDAIRLVAAIHECLLNSDLIKTDCDTPSELPLKPSELSIYTGFHYGDHGSYDPANPLPTSSYPPDEEEPNWLFGIRCDLHNTFFAVDPVTGQLVTTQNTFVVTYVREGNGSALSYRCLDGTV
jgi:prepilin-type N-terminal cleavage/methylation domain-containing protein